MDKVPDNSNLITKEMSEVIHRRLFSYSGSKTMTESFLQLCQNEANCKEDIDMLMDAYTKVIVTTIIASIMQSSTIDDNFILKLSQPVRKLLQNTFGAGAIYCKARMEEDFVKSLKGSLDEELNIAMDEALLMEEDQREIQKDNPFFEPGEDDDGDIWIK